MIKSILLIFTIGVTSFLHTDLNDPNIFFSLFLPVVNFLSLIALAIWFVILFHKNGVNQTSSSSGDSGGGGFDSGGGD